MNMDGSYTVVRFAKLTAEKVRTGKGFPVASEGEGVKNCGMTNVFLFLKLYTCRLQVERCELSDICFVVFVWSFCAMSWSAGFCLEAIQFT